MDHAQRWHEQRRAAINSHAAALDAKRAAETAQARELLADFIEHAVAWGLAQVRLRVRVPETRTTYRTHLMGWYLRRNRSLGVDAAGGFYLLDTTRSLRSRLRGVRPVPVDPPLHVGVGGRDGEAMPLAQLLRLRLAAGDDW
ncbi:hypothetical protein JQS43_08105 [Natronosporangium hydrolyticum]|uniref:Uncharacterized protein n=1 Tax=Natronosporangium hydrolyticum TaxID=2811111 RepID=A0A895YEG8_9ACTN|nr:hypothetical protein [Natronosporangium hydrolyticum]QSB16244.1 hypothetical protein JQS43_08105 [Natronosporangium hydrolyticum]